MKLYGLTGGIGMGKSTAAQWLSGQGIPVIDTDLLARQLVEPGQAALEEIKAAFGKDVVAPDGQLQRDILAKLVFSDPDARQRLESILHPRIREHWRAETEAWRKAGYPVGVVVIPLLFETGAESHFDKIICVACSASSQRERLRERGWSEAQIDQRIGAQWPVEKKMLLANYVVWTDTAIKVHEAQLNRIFDHSTATMP